MERLIVPVRVIQNSDREGRNFGILRFYATKTGEKYCTIIGIRRLSVDKAVYINPSFMKIYEMINYLKI